MFNAKVLLHRAQSIKQKYKLKLKSHQDLANEKKTLHPSSDLD